MGVSPATALPEAAPAATPVPNLFEDVNVGLQQQGFFATSVNDLVNWARSSSLWPIPSASPAARSR